MESYKTCIIAYLDILGFKNYIKSKSFESIREVFSSINQGEQAIQALFRATSNDEYDLTDKYTRYNEELRNTVIYTMSDSVIVASTDLYPESLAAVVDICYVIQYGLYRCSPIILLRGAITKGDFYSSGNFVFGKGIVDAYEAQENYAIYPRIIIPKSLMVSHQSNIDGQNPLPLDKDGYYYINTLERFLLSNDNSLSRSDYYRLSRLVSKYIDNYGDVRVRAKYAWLYDELQRLKNKYGIE